jgi:hypothetical protein
VLSSDPNVGGATADYAYYGQSTYNRVLTGDKQGTINNCYIPTSVNDGAASTTSADCTITVNDPEADTYTVTGTFAIQLWSESDDYFCDPSTDPYMDPLDFQDAEAGVYSGQATLYGGPYGFNCTTLSSIPIGQSKETYTYAPITISVSPTTATVNPGGSPQSFTATVSNGAGATVSWTLSPTTGTISSNSGAVSSSPGTATAELSGNEVSADATITVSTPTPTISSITPASWTAGTSFTLAITGTNFFKNTSFSITSPSWSIQNNGCTYNSATSFSCSIAIPANTANVGTSQGATIVVTTGYASSTYPSSGAITIAPIIYTYSISLLTTTSSLTYGSSTTITPVITCKVGTVACGSGIYNPQTANFKVISGTGSLSNTTNAASTVFTDTSLIGPPSQNASVQACATAAPTVCATQTFTLPATTITLNPPHSPPR